MRQLFFLCLFTVSSSAVTPVEDGKWRAAVYEHVLVTAASVGCTENICTREEAIDLLETNLEVLRENVEKAAEQGANLILLPEDGIHGYGFNRDNIVPFLEEVPQDADGSNHCFIYSADDNPEYLSKHYVMVQLSCMAQSNGLYVAACLGSILGGCDHCGPDHGSDCFYNTLVVFDPEGSLVGVYHKYNLWTTELPIYDIDSSPTMTVIETPFGRLGLSICEDLLWKSPVVDLAEQEGIDTLLIPLSWWDMFPHQLAHSNEDAWARGLQINLLAADTHSSEDWTSGSGIFTPNGHAAVYHNISDTSTGQLLVADIDIKPRKSEVHWAEYANKHAEDFEDSADVFTAVVYDDIYNFVKLDSDETAAKVCTDDGTLCCLAEFNAVFESDVYSVGVFSGIHVKDGSVSGNFYIEMCTIMKCDPADVWNTCNQDSLYDYDYLTRSDTIFTSLKLSGTFSDTTRVFPEALFDEVTLQPELVLITPDGVLSMREKMAKLPLVSMSLFGRRYEDDADMPDNFCPAF